MAGLAADDLIVSGYFLSLYALARGVPPEGVASSAAADKAAAAAGAEGSSVAGAPGPAAEQQPQQGHSGSGMEDTRTITVLHGATALALAAAICFVGTQIAAALRYKGGSITVITAITGGWVTEGAWG